ncbi:ABC transporter permease [candidate division KSB1 bacterium]
MKNEFKHAPFIGTLVLKLFLPRSDSEFLLEDFRSVYCEKRDSKGRISAWLWFWGQVFKTTPEFIFHSINRSIDMYKNYIKIALRNIKRQKGYTFINIGGLAVGMACFILILLYIRYEFSYEKHHINHENIYRVNVKYEFPGRTNVTTSSMVPLGEYLKNEIPEILAATRFAYIKRPFLKYRNDGFYEEEVLFTDASVLDIFTFPLVQGDKSTALKEKYTVILTEKSSKKYFGIEDPIGKILNYNNQFDLKVTGVLKDLPENSLFRSDIMVSFPTIEDIYGSFYMENKEDTNLGTYLLLKENSKLKDLNIKINNAFKNFYTGSSNTVLFLQALDRIHMYNKYDEPGNIEYIYIFAVTAIFVILIACINFMNLSTARSANRAREVGMRKVAGSAHRQLIFQYCSETVIYSIISLIIALIIVSVLLPLFRSLTEQNIKISDLFDLSFIPVLIAIALITGLAAGIYPALFLSSVKPVRILKGSSRSVSKSSGFRKILVVVQFTISIALIISTFNISRQLEFMKNKDLGFNEDRILIVPLHGDRSAENILRFKNELLKKPGIISASGSNRLPNNISSYSNITWEGAQNGEEISLIRNRVDHDFIKTYQIELQEGRNFSRDFPADILDYGRTNAGAVIINEAAAEVFGWESPVGKKLIHEMKDLTVFYNVIGVIKNFHFSSVKNPIKPQGFFLRERYLQYLSLKISGSDINSTIGYIEEIWNSQNPGYPFEYYFLDETFDKMYKSEEKMQAIFGYFAFLTVFISCLGLFGLASFAAEQRTKEIGIRKTLGASIGSVIRLLSKEFIKWVLIANIFSWPLAYFFIKNWIREFAYHADIGLGTFVISTFISLLTALATVSYQAIKAASANPVDSLRNE